MLLDLVHLARSLRRSPVSAGAAVLTLALTLGAGTSIFAVVHAVLLTPPPFADPDALLTLGETPVDDLAARPRPIRYATFETWRERARSLAALEGFDGTNLTLTDLGSAERMTVTDVTTGFFALLGATPALGRAFDAEDLARPVVIVSHLFWRAKLAADPAAIGRQVTLGARRYTIVGVMPEAFRFELSPADIWRPLPLTANDAAESGYRLIVLGRLRSGVPRASLADALEQVSRSSTPPARVRAIALADAITGDAEQTLRLLGGAAAVAVLIAFANLAGLLTVRSIDRRRELAMRSALGGPSSEAARQLLIEAQALVAIGTVGGVTLAWWLTPIVGREALQGLGGAAQRSVAVSWPVIAGVVLMASACAWLCALLPATVAARRNIVDVLRRGATGPPREVLVRRLCVSGEVALAFALLVALTVMGRTLFTLLGTNPGFDPRGVMSLQVSLPSASYPTGEQTAAFYSSLRLALQARLGQGAAGIIDEIPLTGDRRRALLSVGENDAGPEAVVRSVSPGYFDVMRIPTIAGRDFDATDTMSAPRRIVVSRSAAERLFGSEQAVGRQVRMTGVTQPAEIVGIVGDVKLRALDETVVPTVYQAASQEPSRSSILVVRSARREADVISVVREEVAQLDRDLPVYRPRPLSEVLAVSPGIPPRRVLTAAFMGFALLAVVLGAVGLFGVVAHDVASRRRELALRVALGADARRILLATFGQGTSMIAAGLAAGGLLSIWTLRVLSSRDFATIGVDAWSIAVPASILILTGAIAVFPAARRAAGTDPRLALRSE